jgi:hypothetical protein
VTERNDPSLNRIRIEKHRRGKDGSKEERVVAVATMDEQKKRTDGKVDKKITCVNERLEEGEWDDRERGIESEHLRRQERPKFDRSIERHPFGGAPGFEGWPAG